MKVLTFPPDRYSAAYKVAHTAVKIGKFVNILSLMAAAAVFGIFVLMAIVAGFGAGAAAGKLGAGIGTGSAPALLIPVGLVILGLVLAVVLTAPMYLLGVLIESTGETLLANLDVAVNTSPFLADEQKTAAMLA